MPSGSQRQGLRICWRTAMGRTFKPDLSVIPQGFPIKTPAGSERSARMGAKMTLLFTGTFYRNFRNPEQLALSLRQLVDLPISFIVVGDNSAFASLFQGLPDVQFLGKRDHFDCLDLQQNADVLVNLGNVQDFQVPGKVYEYLGAGPPILHIQTGPDRFECGVDHADRRRCGCQEPGGRNRAGAAPAARLVARRKLGGGGWTASGFDRRTCMAQACGALPAVLTCRVCPDA